MVELFNAHRMLSTCRTANGDIPWTAINDYAQRKGIDDVGFLEEAIYGFEAVRRALAKDSQPKGDDAGTDPKVH